MVVCRISRFRERGLLRRLLLDLCFGLSFLKFLISGGGGSCGWWGCEGEFFFFFSLFKFGCMQRCDSREVTCNVLCSCTGREISFNQAPNN